MKKRSTAFLAVALALSVVAGASLFFGSQARANDDGRDARGREDKGQENKGRANGRVQVSGSYDAVFTRFEFLGVTDDVLHLNSEFTGPFELTVGDEARTGTMLAPLIARITPNAFGGDEFFGGAVWMFDDGPMCSGNFGGELVPADGFAGIDYRGAFECSDGSTLSLRVVETAPPPTSRGEITGVWVPARARGDKYADDGKDDD